MNWLTQQLLDFIKWLLDPAELIEAAFDVLAAQFRGIGWVMSFTSPELGAKFEAMGNTLGDVPFVKMWAVGTWLLSPIVDPTVLSACVSIMLFAWFGSLVIKTLMWVASLIWTNPS